MHFLENAFFGNRMIKNITKDVILADRIITRDNIFGIATGLMFHKRLKDTAMVFSLKKEKFASLHMFFVFFPIDVVYLNAENQVVEIKINLMPFSIYKPKNKAKYIIEMPAGIIEKSKTEIGDKIYSHPLNSKSEALNN